MIELKTMLRKSINNTELKQCRFFNTFLSYYNLFFLFIQTTYLIVFNTQTYAISTYHHYHIGGVMINILTSNAVDCGFEPRSGHTKVYKIGICCFSAKHTALRRNSTDRLAWNQDNVSQLDDMSIHGLLCQWARSIKKKRVGLLQSEPHHYFIEN
jgi:hypothetical protein